MSEQTEGKAVGRVTDEFISEIIKALMENACEKKIYFEISWEPDEIRLEVTPWNP